MNKTLRNALAVIVGLIVGSIVNMIIVKLSDSIISAPEGADVTSMEGLKKSIGLFQPKHFLFPFLAHALGTLAGAFLAAKISVGNKMRFALTIGFVFLFGGITNSYLLPAPTWFIITDLALAYVPMAWAGGRLGGAGKE